MTIQFSGLATGLETGSIIEQLMNIERMPIARLEADKTWLSNRLSAFTELDSKLKSFADGIKDLNYRDTLLQRSVNQSSTDTLTASASRNAHAGASYQVEVVSLAQVQKSVSPGFTEAADFGAGALSLTVGGTNHNIELNEGTNSLQDIMAAINTADLGVTAAIINDGTEAPLRLILTGADVASTFSLDDSGLTGGTISLGSFNLDDGTGTIINPPIQVASRAHIRVDTIDIYSDSNTLTEAIPGVTLDLLKVKEGDTTSLTIDLDKDNIKATIEAFATGYNEVMSFISSQSVIDQKGGGILGGDASINTIKRRLQNMLTQAFPNSGMFSSMSQLGFETQRDGTLVVNDRTLSAAIDNNLDSVVSLLAGEESAAGAATQFKDYLFAMTSSGTGMLSGKKESIDNNLKRIDTRITSMESRLEQRQKTLEAQFSAMETLVSGLNAQSSYLTQQMDSLSNMMNYRRR